MTLTRTFKRSGFFVLLGVLLSVVASRGVASGVLTPFGVILLVFAVPVFTVSAIRHLLRGILWRVGSRLFVSYVLIGLLPIPFLIGFGLLATGVLAGQHAARRVEVALARRERALERLTERLAPRFAGARSFSERRALFADATAWLAPDLPAARFAWLPASGKADASVPEDAVLFSSGSFVPPEKGCVIVRAPAALLLASGRQTESGTLVSYIPLDNTLIGNLAAETGVNVLVRLGRIVTGRRPPKGGGVHVSTGSGKGATNVSITKDDSDILFEKLTEGVAPLSANEAPASNPFRKRWVRWALPLDLRVVRITTSGQAASEATQPMVFVRSSLAHEAQALFGGQYFGRRKDLEMSSIVGAVLGSLAAATIVVYALAALVAGLLVFRIARATGRLSAGFAEIEKGNFTARAALKGHDQLAELIASFNRMGAHLSTSVAERAEKEAIEHELALARDLQRRLLPPSDFTFPGFEIAVDFRPAAAIGGDFYDFVAEERQLTVVVADVSGHGLPTGIVMASAKASLSALARSGARGAELLTHLDGEILRTTDSRTFVTLAYLEFRVDEGAVAYTNAGHLYPYRVPPQGAVTALANPARPLGLPLPARFTTVTAPLVTGDLWVVLSDGIVEATAPGTDEEFGFARLEAVLARCAGQSAATVKEQVLISWRAFTGSDEPQDDRTLVVLRVLPSAAAGTSS